MSYFRTKKNRGFNFMRSLWAKGEQTGIGVTAKGPTGEKGRLNEKALGHITGPINKEKEITSQNIEQTPQVEVIIEEEEKETDQVEVSTGQYDGQSSQEEDGQTTQNVDPNGQVDLQCVDEQSKPQNDENINLCSLNEIRRKRQYRVGLNIFNKKPERGIRFLIQRGHLEASPKAVARFLLSRPGLSKQMIGEYLGNLQNSFNMAVLGCFVEELEFASMEVDVALRKFQTYFRMPGEAQKIEKLVEVFSHRYLACNPAVASKLHNPETVFVLAFAIMMLNTDLHTRSMKADRRMKMEEFVRNLRSIDDGHDLDRDMLIGIYERIKMNEFRMGSDHITEVFKVQQTIVAKKPNLALPHRRLVYKCRLNEVYGVSKKERRSVHEREIFLFNDLLMVTKKKRNVTYKYRQSFPLCGMSVTLFESRHFSNGIRLSRRADEKVLIDFNARNEDDRSRFVEELKESILEMDEMENLKIEGEKLRRFRGTANRRTVVADMGKVPQTSKLSSESYSSENIFLPSELSNSLLDLQKELLRRAIRKGSSGSFEQ